MSVRADLQSLETALLQRAESLALEYRARARQSRDSILHDGSERLRLREERETLTAQALADRLYRRQVQATELRLQAELDRLRWSLMQRVMQQLPKRLEALVQDEQQYLSLLRQLLAQAARAIVKPSLVAELNARDLERLQPRWSLFVQDLLADQSPSIALSAEPISCSGGVRVRSEDNEIVVDNTFEGRIERLSEEIYQVILERLFPQDIAREALVHG